MSSTGVPERCFGTGDTEESHFHLALCACSQWPPWTWGGRAEGIRKLGSLRLCGSKAEQEKRQPL